MQRLLYGADWDENGICQALRAQSGRQLGWEPGIGVIDESGFVKKGECSAGVARQYCGRVGKVENCQVGVYLGYVAPQGHALLDRELYLPKEWCTDPVRREKAKIPASVSFATKPQLALQMLERAWAEGLPIAWVVGDSTYGNSPDLRTAIAKAGRYYVMEIPKTARVRTDSQAAWQTVAALTVALPADAWTRYALNLSEQGLRWYDWTAQRVASATDDLGEQWLLVRRSVSEPLDFTYCLSHAARETPLHVLAEVAGSRYHIEHLLEEAKGSTGLADYEVRTYPSWYRHMTLALMAHTWLTLLRQTDAQKNAPFATLLVTAQCSGISSSAQYLLAHATPDPMVSPPVVALATSQTDGCRPFSVPSRAGDSSLACAIHATYSVEEVTDTRG
jgi:SRSO17 transposase